MNREILKNKFVDKLDCPCLRVKPDHQKFWGFPTNYSSKKQCMGYQDTPQTAILSTCIGEGIGILLRLIHFRNG